MVLLQKINKNHFTIEMHWKKKKSLSVARKDDECYWQNRAYDINALLDIFWERNDQIILQ